jgi:hypothetical protein
MPEVERGEVKYLRIAHRPGWPGVLPGDPADVSKRRLKAFAGNATGYSFGYWSWSPARVIGEVPVAEDGSAYFRVPVNMPIYFQALDEKHMEVRRMRSSAFFQPGETRGCIGCHARTNRTAIPHTGDMGKAARGAPDTPTPPPFGDTVFLDFEKHVQPIFDRNCVRCHGGDEPKGKLDLSRSKRVDGFLQSYRSLFGLKADEPTPAQSRFFMDEYQAIGYSDEDRAWKAGKKALSDMARGTYPGMLVSVSDKRSDGGVTEPYAFGSHKSKLITHLLEDPEHRKKVKMSEDDWLTLVTWVDANAPYHGTLLNCESGIEPINVRLAPPFAPQNTITMWEYPDEGSEQ